MVTKQIQIEFASPNIRAIDCVQDIRKAAEYAGLNLFSRYRVQLQYPMVSQNNKVYVDIRIPNEIANTFAVGKHLRGVSSYLLDRCAGKYQSYLVGKRLLNYIEMPSIYTDIEGFSAIDRLESIAAFVKLLQRTDKESMDQINRILSILEEANIYTK